MNLKNYYLAKHIRTGIAAYNHSAFGAPTTVLIVSVFIFGKRAITVKLPATLQN
jgi:hypothetical protein